MTTGVITKTNSLALAALAAVALLAPPAAGQDGGGEANGALAACITAAEAKQENEAKAQADRADKLFAALESQPGRAADALTGRARVLAQCRVPFASFMRQGALVEESMELARRALAIDAAHLGARFILGADLYHMPAFLNRTDEAIATFEELIARHGTVDDFEVRTSYIWLGDLYERAKRPADAVRVWRAGLARFPGDASLERRLAKQGGEDPPPPAAADTPLPPASPPPMYALPPIVVQAGGVSVDEPRGATRLNRTDVYTAPGGAADVLQVFQTMPGVTRARDGSDLYVRGGSPAESPVYVNGARLLHAGTFESLNGSVFGVLDPAVMRRAYFSSGGFGARYGNALSGVVDVELEGRPAVFGWRAGANLTSLSGTARVPLGSRTGAWSSVSLTDVSALIWMQDRSTDFARAPRAYKALGGFETEPARGWTVGASVLAEGDATDVNADAFGYRGTLHAAGATRLAALSARRLANEGRSSLRTTASVSERTTDFRFGVLDRGRSDRAIALRTEAEMSAGTPFTVRAGAEASALSLREAGRVPATPALAPGSSVTPLDSRDETSHVGAFLEGEVRVLDDVAVVAGARVDRLPGESVWTVDPRAAIAWRSGDWTVRAGTGIFRQGRWRIGYELPGGSPAGVPTQARHAVAGVQREGTLALRVEAYHKRYDGYVADGRSGPASVDGVARGIDALVRWQSDALTGWLTWSLLDGEVELESGERVPSDVAVTHSVTAVARRPIGDGWELGTTLRYATGRPYTPVIGVRDNGRGPEPMYGDVNSERLPAYVRADGRLSRYLTREGGLFVFYLEALNLLDRRNVMAYAWNADGDARRPVHAFFSYRTLVLGVEAQF